ncbi:MAG: hypothetical protein ACLUQ6_11355, partial [Alistipes onderdonkii]
MKIKEYKPLTEFPWLIPKWASSQYVSDIKHLIEPITKSLPWNITLGDIVEFPWTEKDIQITFLFGAKQETYVTVIKNRVYPSYFALSQLRRQDIDGNMYGTAVVDASKYYDDIELIKHLVGAKIHVPCYANAIMKNPKGECVERRLPVIDYYFPS